MLNKVNVRRTLVIGLGSLQFDDDPTKTVSMLKAATKNNQFIKCTLDDIDEDELFGDLIENIIDNLVDGEQATVESEIFTTVCEYNTLMQNRSKRSKALSNSNKNGKDDDGDEPKVAPQTVKNNQPKKAEAPKAVEVKPAEPKTTEQPKAEESKPVEPKVENNNNLDTLEKAIMNTQIAMSSLDEKTEALVKDYKDGKATEEDTVKAIEGLLLSDKTTITMIQELLKNIEIPRQLIDDIIGQDGKDLAQVKELLRSENTNLTDEQIDVIEQMYLDELVHAEKITKRLNKKNIDQRLFAVLKTLMRVGVEEMKKEIQQISIAKNNDKSFNDALNEIHNVMGDVTISPLIHVNETQPEMTNEEIRQWNETHTEAKPLFNNNQNEAQRTVTQ